MKDELPYQNVNLYVQVIMQGFSSDKKKHEKEPEICVTYILWGRLEIYKNL